MRSMRRQWSESSTAATAAPGGGQQEASKGVQGGVKCCAREALGSVEKASPGFSLGPREGRMGQIRWKQRAHRLLIRCADTTGLYCTVLPLKLRRGTVAH
eukprot:7723952-Pyramimonas_sp.AAC.1